MNLIFDIGGIIIDDSDQSLAKLLNLPPVELEKIKYLVYADKRWSEGVMLGHLPQEDYMRLLMSEYPIYQDAFERPWPQNINPSLCHR